MVDYPPRNAKLVLLNHAFRTSLMTRTSTCNPFPYILVPCSHPFTCHLTSSDASGPFLSYPSPPSPKPPQECEGSAHRTLPSPFLSLTLPPPGCPPTFHFLSIIAIDSSKLGNKSTSQTVHLRAGFTLLLGRCPPKCSCGQSKLTLMETVKSHAQASPDLHS